jgi:hypothetical protein
VVVWQFVFTGTFVVNATGFSGLTIDNTLLRYKYLSPLKLAFKNSYSLDENSYIKVVLKNGEKFSSSCRDYTKTLKNTFKCDKTTSTEYKVYSYGL